MQKQYQERTTLCTWPWRTKERDAEWSALTIAHHIYSTSVPLGMTVAQIYNIPWDWLWVACHMAGVHWGARCKGFCSNEGPHYLFEQSARNPLGSDQVQITLGNCPEAVVGQATINLFTSLEILWGFLTQAVLCSLAGLMSRKKVSVQGFLWVRKVWFTFPLWTFAQETFGKRQKGKRSPVVSVLPSSCESLASKTHAFCARNMGAHEQHTSLECQRYKKQDKKPDSHAAKKGTKKLVSSVFANILEKESSN